MRKLYKYFGQSNNKFYKRTHKSRNPGKRMCVIIIIVCFACVSSWQALVKIKIHIDPFPIKNQKSSLKSKGPIGSGTDPKMQWAIHPTSWQACS